MNISIVIPMSTPYQNVFPEPGPIISTTRKEKSETHKIRRYGCCSQYLIITTPYYHHLSWAFGGQLPMANPWLLLQPLLLSSVMVALFVFSA